MKSPVIITDLRCDFLLPTLTVGSHVTMDPVANNNNSEGGREPNKKKNAEVNLLSSEFSLQGRIRKDGLCGPVNNIRQLRVSPPTQLSS